MSFQYMTIIPQWLNFCKAYWSNNLPNIFQYFDQNKMSRL